MADFASGPVTISSLDGTLLGRGQARIRLSPGIGSGLPSATAEAWDVVALEAFPADDRYRMTFDGGRSVEVSFPDGIDASGGRFRMLLESQPS